MDGRDSSLTMPGLPAHLSAMPRARASSNSRSARASGSSSDFRNLSSNQRPVYSPPAARKVPITSQ